MNNERKASTKQKTLTLLLATALIGAFLYVSYKPSSNVSLIIKGVNIGANHLVAESSTWPKAYWVKPEPDFTWKQLQDLGVNVMHVGGGQEGNVWHIQANENHPYDREYDADWAENLDSFLAKADSYGIKVIFHTMGSHWGVGLGIVAPMHNYRRVDPYSSIPNALAVVDKLGGNNILTKNFFVDDRVLWWTPINEARIDYGEYDDVRVWAVAVLQRIKEYGGETSVCVNDGSHTYPYTFPYIIPMIGEYVDYLQAHSYNHPELAAVCEQGPDADVYQPLYAKFSQDFEAMANGHGPFDLDQIVFTEFGCGNGDWSGVLASGYYGTTLFTTQHQQADYMRAAFDAAKKYGITKLFWHDPVQFGTDDRGFGFIEYDGTINMEPYAVFKEGF
ncbi:MAG: hypothetical protein OEY81_00665 [Candidatus Bathyarchaeota archaeon]|nr:hypothetical protein [Candidatus Bathyarchaeota archaeon]